MDFDGFVPTVTTQLGTASSDHPEQNGTTQVTFSGSVSVPRPGGGPDISVPVDITLKTTTSFIPEFRDVVPGTAFNISIEEVEA